MRLKGRRSLFCAKLVAQAYSDATNGKVVLPAYRTKFDPRNKAFFKSIGVRAGTTGVGVDIGWSLAPTLSARIGYSGLSYKTTLEESDVSYDTNLKLSNLSAFLDWSPLGPFRITAGIVGNGNKADVIGIPTGGTFTINGVPYSANAVLTEYWDVTKVGNDTLLTVTQIVDDPTYLRTRRLIAYPFKKEANGDKWDPTPCSARW